MEVFIFGWLSKSHQSLEHKGLRIFRFCIMLWKDEREPSIKHGMGRKIGMVQVHRNTEFCIELMVSRWNSSGISSQDSTRCSSATKFKSYCWDWAYTPEKFTGRIIFMSMFNDISCESGDNEKRMRVECSTRLSFFAQRFGIGQWSFPGLGSEKKWYSISADSPQGVWDTIAERMWVEFAEKRMSNFPCYNTIVQRSTQKAKHMEKLSIHYSADLETIETIFA